MVHAYVLERADTVKALLLGTWLIACDLGLKLVARIGGCDDEAVLDGSLVARVWAAPDTVCPGTELAGPGVRLLPHVHDGAWLGLGGGLGGFTGQLYGLGLLLLATVATILVARWRWRASGDPQALGALWAGAIISALPRLTGEGGGLAELSAFGASAGVGDVALIWALVWLMWRLVGELRA